MTAMLHFRHNLTNFNWQGYTREGIDVEKTELKVLIIGDSLINSENLSILILKTIPKTKIDIALNGEEGLKLAKTHEPDVILIDVSISKAESLEISQVIKKDKALQATPMLFITDLEEDREFRMEALKAGAEAFLFKPIEDTILVTQLKSMGKIKERNMLIKDRNEQLESLVETRTSELMEEVKQRKEIEFELRKSEEIFRSYIKEAPIGIFVTNALGQYIEANEMACQMMGRIKKEVLCLSITDFLVPNQIEKGSADFRDLVDKGRLSAEYRVRDKAGQEYWINLFGIKINDNCFLAFCIDISERKLSEKMLNQLNENQNRLTEELLKKNEELSLRLKQTINTISKIGEMKDTYTAGHQRRVASLSCAIAREMKLSEAIINNISTGALIHDIGKINIPSDILNKPGVISNLEYQVLQSHVDNSYEIVKEIDFPSQVIEMIHQHHERLDGTGYPQKLAGEQIIIESRILAVADVVEAMMSHRPYRSALGIDAAIDEITIHRGIKYDSGVVDACIKLFRERGFKFTE